MTPPTDLRPLPRLLFVMLLMSLPAAALEPETCFSRQHQGAAINVRVALSRDAAAMMARIVRSERDCVLACCSEEVRTGARCNMAVFKANKQAGEHNCLLFHCPTELDCPLMKAAEGSNTYDIYKGLSHPPTLRPVPMTTTLQTTSTSTSLTTTTTTTQTAPSSMTSLPAETGRKEVEDKHTSVPETTTSATTTTVAPATSTATTTPTTTVRARPPTRPPHPELQLQPG
uniref:MANSC domain containing 1 n=1 Tax=Poecilia formosa TaxID=48698 RepID=A0A096LYB7_POEFO